jgi:hypothetical protein
MSSYTSRQRLMSPGLSLGQLSRKVTARLMLGRGSAFGLLMIAALISFEIFNFGTTEFALHDLLGDLGFAGVRWASILALAFCAMDFAGIARLLSPSEGQQGRMELWYLVAAWFLAATMNAMLTWWSVSLALLRHGGLGNEIVGREALLGSVPIFVALLVWLIRVLLIGSFSLSGAEPATAAPRPAGAAAAAAANRQRPLRPAAASPGPAVRRSIQAHASPASRRPSQPGR